jgi:hypothetical protein
MDKKTRDKGLEIRKAVLGEAYVANFILRDGRDAASSG